MSFQFSNESAAEACKKISSTADIIKAQAEADNLVTTAVLDGLLGPLNLFRPDAYKSGDNKTERMMRNILETNMSTKERQDIYTYCSNAVKNSQINNIDNTNCKYCQTHKCKLSGITQSNEVEVTQSCVLQTAIKKLLEKTNSVSAQALADVLQSADGVLSGSSSLGTDNCNIVKTDMSTKDYLELRSNCSNLITQDQLNDIQFCGTMRNVSQQNKYNNYQNCVNSVSTDSSKKITSDTKIKTELVSKQTTEGITSSASLASSIISGLVILVLIIVGYFVFTEATPQGKAVKQAKQMGKAGDQLKSGNFDPSKLQSMFKK